MAKMVVTFDLHNSLSKLTWTFQGFVSSIHTVMSPASLLSVLCGTNAVSELMKLMGAGSDGGGGGSTEVHC